MKKHLLVKIACFLTFLLAHSYSIAEELTDKDKAFQRNEEIEQLRQSIGSPESPPDRFPTTQAVTQAVDIVLLDSTVTVMEDVFGDIKILGELRNDGDADASFININFTFKDALDTVIGSDYTYIYGSSKRLVPGIIVTDTVLTPGETGAFELYTDIPYSDVDSMYYEIDFDAYDTCSLVGNVELYGNLSKENSLGYLNVLGEVKNTGPITVYWVKFIPTIKNAQGRVIGVGILGAYIDGETIVLDSGVTTDTALSPGAVGSFEVFTLAPYDEVDSITYKINWDEGQAPVVLSSSASAMTSTSATLNGTVHPNSLSTDCYFEYGTTTSYGSTSPKTNVGSECTEVTVSQDITGLDPGTVYHFRMVAENSEGTKYGDDNAFVTKSAVTDGGGGGGGGGGG